MNTEGFMASDFASSSAARKLLDMPSSLYYLMMSCWQFSAVNRPSAHKVKSILQNVMDELIIYSSIPSSSSASTSPSISIKEEVLSTSDDADKVSNSDPCASRIGVLSSSTKADKISITHRHELTKRWEWVKHHKPKWIPPDIKAYAFE
jgi:hypothetical protein